MEVEDRLSAAGPDVDDDAIVLKPHLARRLGHELEHAFCLLRRELADLYEEVDLQPFSTLITTEYDPATRQVVRSERITPLYQHQEP